MRHALDALNTMSAADFRAALAGVFEDAPWVAAAAAAQRPFSTVVALHAAMMDAVRTAPPAERMTFLRAHPELGGAAARAGAIGAESQAEQTGLGLQQPEGDAAEIAALNTAYAERFGFPFILCVRRHTRPSVLAQFRRRLHASAAEEQTAALEEIGLITRLRLVDKVDGPGAPIVHGWLSTHVLDTAHARPAQGVPVTLLDAAGQVLAQAVTNADGRTEAPLISGAPLRIGVYELRFEVGAYFGAREGDAPFLDVVPIRFGISEPEAHYHVPLLVSPGAFSSYRGS